MLIVFNRDHGVYRPGQEVDHPHPGVADTLVRRGIARIATALAGDAAETVRKLAEAQAAFDKAAGGPKRPAALKGTRR